MKPAHPDAPVHDEPVPSRYALKVGDIDVTVISDGTLQTAAETLAANVARADLSAWPRCRPPSVTGRGREREGGAADPRAVAPPSAPRHLATPGAAKLPPPRSRSLRGPPRAGAETDRPPLPFRRRPCDAGRLPVPWWTPRLPRFPRGPAAPPSAAVPPREDATRDARRANSTLRTGRISSVATA
ncbi:hypothetical protein GCM10027091_41960 [Streptomyces daliensis]